MSTISVNHLKKHFRVYKGKGGLFAALGSLFVRKLETVKAVDDISFKIEQGELVGFIGPNGAGKTTTLKCLSGLLYPTEGKIKVLSFNPFERKSEFLKQISLVMGQKNQLWWDLPAIESFKLNKEIYDIKDADFKKILTELCDLLETEKLLNIPVRQLSLGQRMRMELIAALLHHPRILFLDEPTIGLDVVMQKKIRDFVAEYNKRFFSTIILTSHYMTDVKQLCKRVIIIDHGRILYDGMLDKLVEKYADFKIITVVFGSNKVQPRNLEKLGIIKYFEFPRASITVPRCKTKNIATFLLRQFPIEDLTIEEPVIEEVIRLIFTKKKT